MTDDAPPPDGPGDAPPPPPPPPTAMEVHQYNLMQAFYSRYGGVSNFGGLLGPQIGGATAAAPSPFAGGNAIAAEIVANAQRRYQHQLTAAGAGADGARAWVGGRGDDEPPDAQDDRKARLSCHRMTGEAVANAIVTAFAISASAVVSTSDYGCNCLPTNVIAFKACLVFY